MGRSDAAAVAIRITVTSLVICATAACGGLGEKSESYKWGVREGNTAVSLVNAGIPPDRACKTAILSGSMYADNAVLNPTPPPANFNSSDAQQGCLDQLHDRLE